MLDAMKEEFRRIDFRVNAAEVRILQALCYEAKPLD